MYNNNMRRNKIASAEKRNCAIQYAKRNVIRRNCSLLYLSLSLSLFEDDIVGDSLFAIKNRNPHNSLSQVICDNVLFLSYE